jgi:hypothetical protein
MQNVGVVHAALLILVLLLAQSVAAQVGAIYYVSTSGNDSNPGTFAQPWLTIQHAANTATAGATVNVLGGVYNAYVSFPNSGTASEPIIFQSYPVLVGTTLQGAVIDGTGLSCCGSSGTEGLITISGARSYITVNGFEIRNLTATSKSAVPCGVWITGSGTGVQILNNQIHNIVTTSEKSGNACGLFVYGTSQTPITQLVVSGNEVYNLKTGNSESMTINGNVTHFQVTNNIVHDNDNIGIDAIGYEGTGPVGYDLASYGVFSGNTIYNISGIANVGEGSSYDADGLYCDGCAWVTFEHNAVFQVDYGIEVTSENQVCQANGTEWPGAFGVGTPAKAKLPCYGMYTTVRNNLFYYENACGNSIGGYGLATTKGGGSNGGGSSFHDVFVNNTLFDNGTQPGNDSEGTPSGDFQIQYQVGSSQDDYFENNVIYESAASPYSTSPNMWINSYVPANQAYPATLTAAGLTYPAPPATLNWNLYGSAAGYLEGTSILWSDVSSYTNFSNYQTTNVGSEDANSVNADPLFVGLGAYPPNAYTSPGSPTVGAGSTSLSCSVGWCDPNGSSPTSIYGTTDFLGNPRTSGSNIDIGAYENTGVLTENSMEVNLSSAASGLNGGQSTTLSVTVTAIPGGGGAPSGTVSIMSGSSLLETATLMPTGVNSTAVTLPLSASQLAQGNNTLTAVYSGNSVLPCCNPSNPPGGSQTPVPWYPSATSAPITITETPTTSQTITFTTPPPASATYGSSFTVAATASSNLAVTFTASGACIITSGGTSSATYTMTSGTGTCSVTANQAGNSVYLAATPVTDPVNATQAATSINVTSVSPVSEDFALDAPVTITAILSWSGSGSAPTASAVTIGGNGPSSYGTTNCLAPSGNTMTCTNTYTPTTADTPASYTETAVFSGDGNYTGSSSPQTNNFTINQATAPGALTSSLNPSFLGQSVTFTATITGENGQVKGRKPAKNGMKPMDPTGTVTWSANTGCSVSTVTGNPGTATCTTTSLPGGTDTITATYSGDSNHGGSTATLSQVVNSPTTTINVTSVSPAAEDYGADSPVTIAAVLAWTGTGPAPTASAVTIGGTGPSGYSATTCGAPSGTTITCTASYTPTVTDMAGSYTETATFAGDGNYAGSSSPQTGNFTINIASSITSVGSTPNPSTYATSVTFTATINGENSLVKGRRNTRGKPLDVTGTVTWSANTGCGTTNVTTGNPGIASCTTSSATHLPVGTDTVTASYNGDSNHSGSSGSVNQVVQGGIATTIDVTSVSPSSEEFAADTPATITAVLSWTGHGVAPTAANMTIGGNGNGTYGATSCAARVHETITCTATYTPTNADVAGTYTETATFSGDSNYTASSSPETNNFSIGSNASTTSVSSGLNPSTYGGSVTFTATITSDTGDVKGRKPAKKNGMQPMQPTGTVTWSANTGCSASTLTGTYPGSATCTTSNLNAGAYTITATYSGDSNHGGSSGSVSQTVNQASQTINVTTPAPSQVVKGSTFTVVASATSGLPISFGTTGACTNSGGTITMSNTASGTCNIAITQAGNSNYAAATPVNETTTIAAAAAPTVSFTGAPTTAPYQSSFTVSATTNASTTAVITATPATVCTISGNTVTMVSGTGTCTMKASWAADDVYKAATATQTTHAAKIAPTATFTGAPSTAVYQSTFTVADSTNASTTATITAGPASVCTISSGTVTMASGTGTCTTTAKWAADDNYLAATLTQTTTAQELTSTVSWTAPSPITYGTTLSGVLNATANVAGRFAYTANGNAVTATTVLPAGSYTMGVTFTPTANKDYPTATASVSLTVNPTNTTTTITKATAPRATPLAMTVSITVANGLTATHDATGSVTVTASSGETCTASLTAGKGSCVLTTAVAESGTLTAVYSGDSNNNGSTSAAFSFTD